MVQYDFRAQDAYQLDIKKDDRVSDMDSDCITCTSISDVIKDKYNQELLTQ